MNGPAADVDTLEGNFLLEYAKKMHRYRDEYVAKFLEDAGVTEKDALMNFNLAPLATRRDIAMLGVLHRAMVGQGPPHFKEHFMRENGRRMFRDPRSTLKGPLVVRSVLGLVAIYNLLPESCRQTKSVSEFQNELVLGVAKNPQQRGSLLRGTQNNLPAFLGSFLSKDDGNLIFNESKVWMMPKKGLHLVHYVFACFPKIGSHVYSLVTAEGSQ